MTLSSDNRLERQEGTSTTNILQFTIQYYSNNTDMHYVCSITKLNTNVF